MSELVALMLAVIPFGAHDSYNSSEAVGAKVVEFARSKVGEVIGNGQCTALVAEALRHAGARRPSRAGGWGEPLDSLAEARPGDVLEFEDARFAGRRVNPNRTFTQWSYHFPHHAAIVSAVKMSRSAVVLRVLHQNAKVRGQDESDSVKEWTINMATLQDGTVRAYRPILSRPPETEGSSR